MLAGEGAARIPGGNAFQYVWGWLAKATESAQTSSMIDHTGLQVTRPELSRRFYQQALAPLGYSLLMQVPTEFTGGKAVLGFGVAPKADFWLTEGVANEPRIHVAFSASSRAQVDAFHSAALAAGGKDNGAPGPRPQYHENYYGAFVLDPDGHNIEAVFHGA